MERLSLLCLIASSLTLQTVSQNLFLAPDLNPSILNPDLVYFTDNRPNIGKALNLPSIQPSRALQPPLEDRPEEEPRQIINGASLVHAPFDINRLQNPGNRLNGIQIPIGGKQFIQMPVVRPNEDQVPVVRPNEDQEPVGPSAAQLSVNLDERLSDEAEDEARKVIRLEGSAAALTNFSLNLMKNMVFDDSRNSVVSPYSVVASLSLLQQGATNKALEQISEALQMSAPKSAASYRFQVQSVQARNSRNILRTANNIFLADGFKLNPEFLSLAQRAFNSDVTPINFGMIADAVLLINSWISVKTNKKIEKLVSAETLPLNSQMVLVNAMYFKGFWDVPFRTQNTKPGPFRLGTGTVKTVPFMQSRRYLRAGLDNHADAKIVVLPFERDEYSLMIILPSLLTTANDALRSLTIPQLEMYLNYKPVEILLKVPKFSIKSDTDLAPVLKRMGITKIFEQRSELSGLGNYQSITPQVSSAVHSALLSIDEEGGTAAAATAFGAIALSNTEPFHTIQIDRPFIAVLWDGKTRVPLFIAKIEDPTL